MKLSTKIWLLVGGLLVLLGGLAFAVSMAANQWDFSKLDPARYENRTVEISEDFQNISIRSDTEDIVFAPSGDGRCRVVFYEQEKRTHTAEVVGGTLVIGQADAGKWYESFSFFGFGSPKITVYLPGAEYAALSIEESTGDIEIPKDFSFARIDISVSTGDVTCAASAKGAIHRPRRGPVRCLRRSSGPDGEHRKGAADRGLLRKLPLRRKHRRPHPDRGDRRRGHDRRAQHRRRAAGAV